MLHNFETIRRLGQGSYSTVFKVRNKTNHRNYALKKVRLSSLKQKEKENALNQVRILASVNHPNIIAYKQSFIQQKTNTLFLVMQLAQNGDLLQKINEHKKKGSYFPEQQVWNIAFQATRGLKALHDLQILHRDLKCANIFLMKDGTVKLGDMNVSKVTNGDFVYTQTGTPYYASPQVWKDNPYDQKSDIWSLGCVIYQMAALEPPFQASNMKGLFRKVVRGEYPPLPDCYSADLHEFVRFLLKVNPVHRPECTRILKHHLIKMRSVSPRPRSSSRSEVKKIKKPSQFKYISTKLPGPRYDDELDSRKKLPQVSKSPQISPKRVWNKKKNMNRIQSQKTIINRLERRERQLYSPQRPRVITDRHQYQSPSTRSPRKQEITGLPPLPIRDRSILKIRLRPN